MSIPTQNRQPAGSPAGGQFAPAAHHETDLDLGSPPPVELPDVEEMTRRRGNRRAAYQVARGRLDDATLGVLVTTMARHYPQAHTLTAGFAEDGNGGHLVLDVSLDDHTGQPVPMRVDSEVAAMRLVADLDIDDFASRLCRNWRGPGREADIGELPNDDRQLRIDLRAAAEYLSTSAAGRR